MEFSKPFQAAWDLLKEEPLSPDAAERLEELSKHVTAEEAKRFGDLWSAYYAAGGKLEPADEEGNHEGGL